MLRYVNNASHFLVSAAYENDLKDCGFDLGSPLSLQMEEQLVASMPMRAAGLACASVSGRSEFFDRLAAASAVNRRCYEIPERS